MTRRHKVSRRCDDVVAQQIVDDFETALEKFSAVVEGLRGQTFEVVL